MKKTYWVLWTYCANFADSVVDVQAENVIEAIMGTYGHAFNLRTSGASNREKNREKITFHVFSTDGHEYSGNFNRLEMLSCENCEALCREGDLNHNEATEMAVCSACSMVLDKVANDG